MIKMWNTCPASVQTMLEIDWQFSGTERPLDNLGQKALGDESCANVLYNFVLYVMFVDLRRYYYQRPQTTSVVLVWMRTDFLNRVDKTYFLKSIEDMQLCA